MNYLYYAAVRFMDRENHTEQYYCSSLGSETGKTKFSVKKEGVKNALKIKIDATRVGPKINCTFTNE